MSIFLKRNKALESGTLPTSSLLKRAVFCREVEDRRMPDECSKGEGMEEED